MAEVKLEDAPRKARELFEKAVSAFERDNLEYAMDMFLSVLELEPRLLKARKYLRAAEMKKFKAGKGGELTHLITSLTGLGHMLKAKSAMTKKPTEALVAAEKLLRMDPLNKGFMRVQAEAALACDMPEVAIQTLEIAREHYPKDYDLLTWLGQVFVASNDPTSARECFERVVAARPNDQKALKSMKDAAALATMQKGKWDSATSYRDVMKDKDEAIELEQQNKAVKTGGDLAALIAANLKRVEQEPENMNHRRALAELYSRDGQYDAAIQALEEAQRISGGDSAIDLSLSQTRLAKFDRQIKDLEAAGDAAGADAARAARAAFQMEDAQRRVERYPNDLQFRFEYGVLLFEADQINEAIQQLQMAQRNPQRRIRALYYLARCFESKGQFDIAVEQLEKASGELTMMDDTKKDILYALGVIYQRMGDKEKAVARWKEVYAVDISYRDIAAKIDQAYQG
ncbi:MAG: tetratricopeptide repeat protein [Candidatus Marinimicrobia bacterium]|nr:tetratricopeptide repeat protein [Candidatus Neomarinimicrobiota bacterium]